MQPHYDKYTSQTKPTHHRTVIVSFVSTNDAFSIKIRNVMNFLKVLKLTMLNNENEMAIKNYVISFLKRISFPFSDRMVVLIKWNV